MKGYSFSESNDRGRGGRGPQKCLKEDEEGSILYGIVSTFFFICAICGCYSCFGFLLTGFLFVHIKSLKISSKPFI